MGENLEPETVDAAAKMAAIEFDDLPAGHPIKKYCEVWGVEDPVQRADLCELVKRAVLAAVEHTIREILKEGEDDEAG